MNPSRSNYPPSPKTVDLSILNPSPQFRREAFKVLVSIFSFILIYLVLVSGATLLALLCGYGGFTLIVTFPKFITLMLGLGLIGVGLMVLYFLFKFIFSKSKVDRSNLLKITENDYPELFQFIRTLAADTQTPMPKHVYLSPDVNASVFYDSGFWSMFLPVRKNLQIGLGLVNVVNVSEFKAIVAHEFGHFSQRSMKLGSYVYNVNKVIYNMLYDNDDYALSLQAWANISNYFYLFAEVTGKIVAGIQSILKLQYTRINRQYMALSRQMEFHADTVAASVSGSMPLITSLKRLDACDNCYHQMLSYYNTWYKDHNRKASNIYEDHRSVLNHFAEVHNISTAHGLLQMGDSNAGIATCRVMINDQWASHPSTEERESHLRQLNIPSEETTESAWRLFRDAEGLQRKFTERLYRAIAFDATPEIIDTATFKQLFRTEVDKYALDKAYKGYYNDRRIEAFDPKEASVIRSEANALDSILTAEVLRLPAIIAGLEQEIKMLEAICDQQSSIKSFEFSNKKVHKDQAPALLDSVKQELGTQRELLLKTDREIFIFYHTLASRNGKGQEAIDGYQKMFTIAKSVDEEIKVLDDILTEVGQLYRDNVSQDMAVTIDRNMRRKEEPIRKKMRDLLVDEQYSPCLSNDQRSNIERYIASDWIYYKAPRLESEAINLFVQSMSAYGSMLSMRAFETKRQTLSRQLEIINCNVPVVPVGESVR